MQFLDRLTKQLLVLPTWAVDNFSNQLVAWADQGFRARGKYVPLRKCAEASDSFNDGIAFVCWMAILYTAMMVQLM
jgi:hypothetical protein